MAGRPKVSDGWQAGRLSMEASNLCVEDDSSMIGHHFIVSDSTDGRIAGHALICPDARYASIRWRGADRMDRRFIRGQAWAPVIAETVARDWPEGQVDLQSELGRLIVPEDRRAVLTVRHASDPQFPADCVLGELDAYLHAQSFP